METVCPWPVERATVLNPEYRINWNREFTVGFAAGYVRRKARQLVGRAGFTSSDRSDLEQDMLLALYERGAKFDPARGHWNVFVVTVIERYVATLLKARRTTKRSEGHRARSLSTSAIATNGKWTELSQLVEPRHAAAIHGSVARNDLDFAELQSDIAAVIRSLPSEARQLCWFLLHGSISELARKSRVSRTTICDRLKKLRSAFASADLAPISGESAVNRRTNAVGD